MLLLLLCPCSLQLLASAEEEASRHAEEAALMRRSVDAKSALRAAAEARLAEESRQRLDLEQAREELAATSGEQAAVVASQDAELAQLRGELARARAEGLSLAEDKALLEVS
jgi:hypothetical protein